MRLFELSFLAKTRNPQVCVYSSCHSWRRPGIHRYASIRVVIPGEDQESSGMRLIELIGVRKALASLPSEPCVRFSRTRLSSRWFPHRDWLATHRASFPACQFRFVFVFPVSHLVSRWCHNILTLLTDTTMVKSPSCAKKRSPLTPLPRAANIRSIHIVVSTHLQ